jgi:GH18 family chitinase
LDADAANLNQLPLGDGLFYSGVTDVNAKAEIVISSNAAGMFIWTMENDTQAVGKSLTKAMNDKLNTQ